MGFALWRRSPLAYCSGTHEYRPMGTAVIHESGVFTARDFSAKRMGLARGGEGFEGYFASLAEVNDYLRRKAKGRGRNSHRILPTI